MSLTVLHVIMQSHAHSHVHAVTLPYLWKQINRPASTQEQGIIQEHEHKKAGVTGGCLPSVRFSDLVEAMEQIRG